MVQRLHDYFKRYWFDLMLACAGAFLGMTVLLAITWAAFHG